MLNSFDQKKQKILQEIQSDDLDLSPKGTIDELCIPIINLINSNDDMVTTSSCSGRVSVYLEGTKSNRAVVSKGNHGRWLFVTHEPHDLKDWTSKINFVYTSSFPDPNARLILYKFEPLILHVKCRNLETANKLYQVAMNNGFRESGIGSNFNVAIRISIKLDIPIGYKSPKDEEFEEDILNLFVTKDYIKYIDQLSLERFEENSKKLNQLYKAIEKDLSNGTVLTIKTNKPNWESKEERRRRMVKEGLKRQEELRELKQDQIQ
ncbi:unnamed protein product [Candida verbasci]|uniref:tRNA wybutosine-synthesizing protein 3 n=1 Tax=Candida verbasci TaxID=1227364 RepID=A0A9W4X8E2_9ASCO|nr:unnamed protein product [Candida verbasci]